MLLVNAALNRSTTETLRTLVARTGKLLQN